jgi:hypothetical protein
VLQARSSPNRQKQTTFHGRKIKKKNKVWLALQVAVLWTDAKSDRATKPVFKYVRHALDATVVA